MQPDDREVAYRLREVAALLELGLAHIRYASVSDTRNVVLNVDGSYSMPKRYRKDYLQAEALVEGGTVEGRQMSATVSWSFTPES